MPAPHWSSQNRRRGICSHRLRSTGQVSVSLPMASNRGGWCHGPAATVEAPFPNSHNSSPFPLFLPKPGYLFWREVEKWICSLGTRISIKINSCMPKVWPLTPLTTVSLPRLSDYEHGDVFKWHTKIGQTFTNPLRDMHPAFACRFTVKSLDSPTLWQEHWCCPGAGRGGETRSGSPYHNPTYS